MEEDEFRIARLIGFEILFEKLELRFIEIHRS